MIVFEGPLGRVTAVDDPGVQARVRLLGLPDAPVSYEAQRSIITQVTLAQKANVQFMHSMGAHVYVYVFGDRIGQVGLAGLAFADACLPDGSPAAARHGAELMLRWYRENRVSTRRAPVQVMIGDTAVDGFLTDFTTAVADPGNLLVQWNATLMSLPLPP